MFGARNCKYTNTNAVTKVAKTCKNSPKQHKFQGNISKKTDRYGCVRPRKN